MTPSIVVLASGSGTLLQAMIDAGAALGAEIVAIGADRDCEALARADRAGIDRFSVSPSSFPDRQAWDRALTDEVQRHNPEWVVSAGFMRLLGPAFLSAFGGRIINSHPALLPAFPGAHGVADALDYGVKVTGCTVHLVDSGVDTGPIIAQEPVAVLPDDDADSLHERIKVIERRLLVSVVSSIARQGYTIHGRKVTVP